MSHFSIAGSQKLGGAELLKRHCHIRLRCHAILFLAIIAVASGLLQPPPQWYGKSKIRIIEDRNVQNPVKEDGLDIRVTRPELSRQCLVEVKHNAHETEVDRKSKNYG